MPVVDDLHQAVTRVLNWRGTAAQVIDRAQVVSARRCLHGGAPC